MGKIAGLFVAGLALIIGLSIAAPLAQSVDDWNEAARRQRELALAEQQYEFWRRQQWDAATAPGRVAANYLWAALTIVAAAGAVLKLSHAYDVAQRRKDEDRRVVYPDARGLLPVPRAQLEAGEPMDDRTLDLIARYLLVQQRKAEHQPGQTPASLHQHTTYAPPALDRAPAAPALADGGAGEIEVVKPLDGWLPWADAQPHILLGGRTKAGKTTTATAILARRLLARETVFIIDPHSSGWLGLPTAGRVSQDGELQRALGAVLAEYLRRMGVRDAHKAATGQELPHTHFGRMTVLIDEANAIADTLPGAWSTFAKQLASGSRKVGISLLLLAQSPLVEDLKISGGMRENFARIALDDKTVGDMIDRCRDAERKAALRAALVDLDYPAAAYIGAQVWLLDRSEIDSYREPTDARTLIWQGWDFDRGARVSSVSTEEHGRESSIHLPASEADLPPSSSLPTPAEIAQIAALLEHLPPSRVVEKLDGYHPRNYAEYKAKVDYVQSLLGGETRS